MVSLCLTRVRRRNSVPSVSFAEHWIYTHTHTHSNTLLCSGNSIVLSSLPRHTAYQSLPSSVFLDTYTFHKRFDRRKVVTPSSFLHTHVGRAPQLRVPNAIKEDSFSNTTDSRILPS